MGKDKWGEELDKLTDSVLRIKKCDYCSYRPSGFPDYVQHLKDAHPENGDTRSV